MERCVKVWNGDDIYTGGAWVIKEEHEEVFEEMAKDAGAGDLSVCVVSKKGSERMGVFLKSFQYELAGRGVALSVKLNEVDSDAHLFFTAWEELVAGVNSLDLGMVRRARMLMQRYDSQHFFLWKTNQLLELLEDYVGQARRLAFQNSVVGSVPLMNRREDWWEEECTWTKQFETLTHRIGQSDVAKPFLEEVLLSPLLPICGLNRSWKRGSAEAGLSVMWPHFVRCAIASLTQESHNFVVLYVHRALDAYFQMRAIADNVVEVGSRLAYKNPRWERQIVTLCETERKLVKEAQWAWDRDRENYLREINRARNLLRETHGAYDCSQKDAEIAVEKFERLMRRIGSPADVSRLNECSGMMLKLKPIALFEVEDAFHAFIVRTNS